MFGPPANYVPTLIERDLAERWLPTPEQITAALALLATLPTKEEYVYVAIALPGKSYGVWRLGQPVEHVEGAWLTRDRAVEAAETHLGDRPGTPSYAVVWRDGHAAVWEDFPRPEPEPPATTLPTGTVRLDSIPF